MKITDNFKEEEFYCRGERYPDDLSANIVLLAQVLQVIRDAVGRPIKVISGWRSPEVNTEVGGATRSKHLWGSAADISCPGLSIQELAEAIGRTTIHNDLGIGVYPRHIHVDLGPPRRWDKDRY